MSKEKTGDTYRYTTQQLMSYRERLENAITNFTCRVIPEKGMGLPLAIKKPTAQRYADNGSINLLAQGPAYCHWKDFLNFYIKELDNLPAPYFPVTKYLFDLSQKERDLWLTLFPAATFLKEYSEFKAFSPSHLLEQTILWTKEKINKII